MLTGKDIRKIALWAYNVDLDVFAKQVYGEDVWTEYHKEKWHRFQKSPVRFILELDSVHLARVAAAVNEMGG